VGTNVRTPHAPVAYVKERSEKKHEYISMKFCRECLKIKQVTINIQCLNTRVIHKVSGLGLKRLHFLTYVSDIYTNDNIACVK